MPPNLPKAKAGIEAKSLKIASEQRKKTLETVMGRLIFNDYRNLNQPLRRLTPMR